MLRVLSFTIHEHPFLDGCKFDLCNPDEDKVDNYFSVVIGPNGTGKSYLLSNLINAFNEIALLKIDEKYKPKCKFTVKYMLGENEFEISTEYKEILYMKNTHPVSKSKIELPNKWLASSVTINDKFPMLTPNRNKQIPEYKYLGIRTASNNSFISRITLNSMKYFVQALRNGKMDKIFSVYKSLLLSPNLRIDFGKGSMLKIFRGERGYNLKKDAWKIIDPHIKFVDDNSFKTSYRADLFKKYIKDKDSIEKVYDFIQKHSEFENISENKVLLKYEVDIENGEGVEKLLKDWAVISIMLDLDMIKVSNFKISKESAFSYEEASSGENHLLTSLHGIISNLEDNSLLVIDEPEISLHPNWQIEYIEILKILLENYKGVNVVIATHSHFMVSSLKNEESRILSLRREIKSKELEIEVLDFDTYGWDPDRILYKIFGLVTLRNNYFENDLRSLISLITNKDSDKKEVMKLYSSLKKYILSDKDDPLKVIISRTESFLNTRND